MAVNLRNTNTVAINGLKVLVYGEAGAGKTTLSRESHDSRGLKCCSPGSAGSTLRS